MQCGKGSRVKQRGGYDSGRVADPKSLAGQYRFIKTMLCPQI